MIGHPSNLCAVDVHVCLAILITFAKQSVTHSEYMNTHMCMGEGGG